MSSLLGSTVLIVYIDPICFASSIAGKNFLADSINLSTLVYLGFFIIPLFIYLLYGGGISGFSPILRT